MTLKIYVYSAAVFVRRCSCSGYHSQFFRTGELFQRSLQTGCLRPSGTFKGTFKAKGVTGGGIFGASTAFSAAMLHKSADKVCGDTGIEAAVGAAEHVSIPGHKNNLSSKENENG